MESPTHNSYFLCIGHEEEDETSIAISQINASSIGAISSVQSNLNTIAGFSGGPYIDANKKNFGIHIKSTADGSVSNGE